MHRTLRFQDAVGEKMDCAEDEYYLHGECHKCHQCPPGQELREDCGFGLSGPGVCVLCEMRWFKGEWGSHPCRMCQSCRHLNRQEITLCTHTNNAVCGDCLPGFYSKRRLDRLQDLECLPCGPAPFRNAQCKSEGEVMEKVWSSEAPPHNAVVMTTACVAAVTMVTVLFVTMVLMCKGFRSFRKSFKGCLSPSSNSHRDIASVPVSMVTEHSVTLVPETEAPEPSQSLAYPCSVATVITPDPCPHHSSVCESLPLECSSTCNDQTSGVFSQAAGSPDVPPGQTWPSSTLTDGLCSRGQYCAEELESAWGHHAPVECSELDLINISSSLELQTPVHTQNQLPLSTHTSPSPGRGGGGQRGERGGESESAEEKRSSCEDAPATRVTLVSESELIENSRMSLQGMHLGTLPLWLVRSLALKLDPVFPGVSNFQKVALQLGMPSDVLPGLQGFEDVFHFLSSTTLLTVPDLIRALGDVRRLDTVLLISEYASNINVASGSINRISAALTGHHASFLNG